MTFPIALILVEALCLTISIFEIQSKIYSRLMLWWLDLKKIDALDLAYNILAMRLK